MPRKDGRIEPGQRLTSAISAQAWNRAQDAADIVLGDRYAMAGELPASFRAPYTWVYAKPSSAVSRWDVLKVTGVSITPTSTDTDAATVQFQSMPVLTVGSASTGESSACVAIEPIAANKIGRVAVAGCVQVRAPNADKLGSKLVLWKDSNWALVVLGGGGGGIRLGRIGQTWNKGATATVDELDKDGNLLSPTVTFTAKNWFATVTVSGGYKKVACGQANGEWILIAAEC